jgi:hypothetical protein
MNDTLPDDEDNTLADNIEYGLQTTIEIDSYGIKVDHYDG